MSDVTEIKMSLVKHSTSFLSPFVDQNLWLSVNKVFKTVHYVFIHHIVISFFTFKFWVEKEMFYLTTYSTHFNTVIWCLRYSFMIIWHQTYGKALTAELHLTHIVAGCPLIAHVSLGQFLLVDPLRYFWFQPVLYNWCNKGCGMCYPVCGMVHLKVPLLLIEKSTICNGGSRFPLSLSDWSFTICLVPYNHIKMCWVHRSFLPCYKAESHSKLVVYIIRP